MENNNHINQQFDGFFKQSFENFEPELPQGIWENIDHSVGNAGTGSLAGTAPLTSAVLFKVVAVVLPLAAGLLYFAIGTTTQNPDLVQPAPVSSKQHPHITYTPDISQPVIDEPSAQSEQNIPAYKSSSSRQDRRSKAGLNNQKIPDGRKQIAQHKPTTHSFSVESKYNLPVLPKKQNQEYFYQNQTRTTTLSFTVTRSTLCADESVEFNPTSSGYERLRWDFDDGVYHDQYTANSVVHRFAKPGWYNVTLIGYTGSRTERYSQRVRVIKPMAYFTVSSEKAPLLQFINHSQQASQYIWDFGDHSPFSHQTQPQHRYGSDEPVHVRLIAQNGTCADTFSMEVKPAAGALTPLGMLIPNVFTPNQDGINDEWGIEQAEGEVKITVLDRSGKKVFESNQTNIKWDGNDAHGKEYPSGDYFYIIVCKPVAGDQFTRTGLIKLMR